MSKVFMIIGKSFSGKDYLLKQIISDHDFCKENNIRQLIRYTTRKHRPTETDGCDYFFISDEYYERDFKNNDKAIVSSYETVYGTWHYITDFSKLDSDKNYIMVGDPESIEKSKEILGNDLCLIYLVPPNSVIFSRFSNRDDNETYSEKYKEIYRRFMDDLVKFGEKSNRYIANCNCIINLGKELHENDIKFFIKYFINGDDSDTGIIINNEFSKTFSAKYNIMNEHGITFSRYYNLIDIMSGQIQLCNGKIHLYTEDEECFFY